MKVAGAVKQARKSLQALLGAAFDHEIVFTSGGTESDNAAILSALDNRDGRDEIVTTAVEHPAILALVEHLESARGIKCTGSGSMRGPAGYRGLSARARSAHRDRVGDVGQQRDRNAVSGRATGAMAHGAGALFHTDAVQAVGKIRSI